MKPKMKTPAKAAILAAILVAPMTLATTAAAHDARAQSPARHLLGQMIGGGMPVIAPRGFHDHDRFDGHGVHGVTPALVGSWSLRAFRSERHGMIRLYPDGEARFRIEEDGRLSFSVGCNRFSAWMTTGRHGQIGIGAIAGTRMLCAPDEARLERRVTDLLGAVARYEMRGETLRLQDAAGTVLLEFDGGPHLMRPYRAER
jgi:heat shock protein HslJ